MTGPPAVPRPARPTQPAARGTARPAARPSERLDAATVRSAMALLREPFWLRIALAVVVLSVAFFFLGRWQLGRHQAKVARNEMVAANYHHPPVPLRDVLPDPGSPLAGDRQWTQVRLDGVYDPARQVLIRNRPLRAQFGYEVVVPLRLTSGATFLVDRGWVPPGERFVEPDTVPPPPSGPVSVVVRVRPGEPPLDRTPPPGQELRIDLGRLATAAGGTVYRGAYGVLAGETPAPPTAPAALPEPDQDLGPHLAYAVQWWIGDVAAYGLLGYYAVKEARLRRAALAPAAPPDAAPTDDAEPADDAPPTGDAEPADDAPPTGDAESTDDAEPARPAGAVRWWHRRRREGLTDEEYEDAAGG